MSVLIRGDQGVKCDSCDATTVHFSNLKFEMWVTLHNKVPFVN